MHALLEKYELGGFTGTNKFGKAGMEWLMSTGGELSRVDRFVLDANLRQIELLNQLIDEAGLKIAGESIESDDVKLLMTIPGVDYYTAMLFVSEIGDITRFPESKKLISWLGSKGTSERQYSL